MSIEAPPTWLSQLPDGDIDRSTKVYASEVVTNGTRIATSGCTYLMDTQQNYRNQDVSHWSFVFGQDDLSHRSQCLSIELSTLIVRLGIAAPLAIIDVGKCLD